MSQKIWFKQKKDNENYVPSKRIYIFSAYTACTVHLNVLNEWTIEEMRFTKAA